MAKTTRAKSRPTSPRARPPSKPVVAQFDLASARSLWFGRQGLGAAIPTPLPKQIAKCGWLRTLGGADVYIAARARHAGMHRAELDEAVESHSLRVLPAVRSCIYLVPEEHATVARSFAEGIWRKRTDREITRAGTTWAEIEEVGQAVADVLRQTPLTTDAIRRALPAGTVRSLGEAGKKLGLSSPLPVALRDLEFRSVVERTLEGGRLDTERYVWRLAQPTAPEAGHPTHTECDLLDSITRIFFSQMGPATAASFAEWAGVAQRDALASIERVGLVPIAIDGYAPLAFIDEAGLPALSQPVTYGDHVSFLSFEDNLIVPHGGPASFCDPAHHDLQVMSWGTSKPVPLGAAKHLSTRTILIGDRIAGFWELDPDAQELVTWLFEGANTTLAAHVESEATAFARFLFEEVGHARAFSLDTDDAVRERATALRQRVRTA